jgi:hypothetical protein
MSCLSCVSGNQAEFSAEINIHLPSFKKQGNKDSVLVFPKVLVCADCGYTQFALEESELRLLGTPTAA